MARSQGLVARVTGEREASLEGSLNLYDSKGQDLCSEQYTLGSSFPCQPGSRSGVSYAVYK